MKTIETMEENKYLLSYLRKGLGQYIKNDQNAKGSRASIDIKVEVEGKKVPSAPNSLSSTFSTKRTLSLVGPADVKQVKPSIISQFYPPAINTQRFSDSFMPYMEFYEADFPWRYTPLPAKNGNCTPWLVLVAVTDNEYKLETKDGKKKVEFFLTDNRYKEVFPSAALHSKLAHVHLENKDNEEGISRLLCGSKLPAGEHITVFLLPAFETGRLSGLDMDYDNVNIGKLSWSNKAKEFPVYYHWSYYTSELSGSFEEIANKLDMMPTKEYDSIKANLTVDIAKSGLAVDGLKLDKNGEYVIDVPAALNLALGKEVKLREEPEKEFRQKLEEELLLNPVFVENTTGHPPVDEDPWVVPPVYGARHLLSEDFNGKTIDGKDDVVKEVNLTLRHRIAAGMGASVVKENQESFVHRAWQKVEKINELNQELREYYEMQEVEQKAEGRLANETASTNALTRHKKLLTSDALPRTLNTSKLAHNLISVNDIRQVVNNKNWKPVQKDQRIIGITPEELQDLFSPKTWEDFIKSGNLGEAIAEQIIEQYKQENNWMQYLLMPYYNRATDPKTSERKIYGIKPDTYQPKKNPYFISAECTDLFCWMNKLIADDAHTLNYYLKAADEGINQKGIFQSTLYDADSNSPIQKAVYPLTLQVIIEDMAYDGYIMDNELLKQNFKEKFAQNNLFISFEYNETLGASVKKKKNYIFLFPSDYPGLIYKKSLHFNEKEVEVEFKYNHGSISHTKKLIPSTNINSYSPFTDNDLYKKTLGKLMHTDIAKEAKTDSNHPNTIYLELDGRKFYIQTDGSMGITQKNGKVIVNEIYYNLMKQFMNKLKELDYLYLKTPNSATIKLNSFDNHNIKMTIDDYELNTKMDTEMENKKPELYEQLSAFLSNLSDTEYEEKFGIKLITPEPEEPEPVTPNLNEEKQNTIETLIKKYGYTEEAQLQEIKAQIEKGKLTKYPVMIYPDFLDPTFFYLRELSENYIVPSAGELTNNSVTVFQSNAAFEEAFLMGMNTEMGQELLWREYPTDQRGSYFRKFWVAAQLPEKEKLETEYFDIKKIHNWRKKLGNNHVKQKAQMLVFAIKGELMQAYPKTTICLSQYDNNTITITHQASMASWLTEDTYLVGFDNLTIQEAKANNLCLTFQEDVTSLQFENKEDLENHAKAYDDSASLGLDLMNTQTVFLLPINNK